MEHPDDMIQELLTASDDELKAALHRAEVNDYEMVADITRGALRLSQEQRAVLLEMHEPES